MGFGWLYLWLRYLPAYTQWVNQVWAAFGAVFLWGGLCAALARLLNSPNSGIAGYVFFIGTPTAAFAGYALACLRFHTYARGAFNGDAMCVGEGAAAPGWCVSVCVRCWRWRWWWRGGRAVYPLPPPTPGRITLNPSPHFQLAHAMGC